MGDKAPKDKNKGQKQQATKNAANLKKKQDKQPKAPISAGKKK